TPTEQKAVKSAASSFRPNPAFKTEAAITEMGVGEALVSTLEAKGAPTMVQKTMIRPPSSRLGPATDPERADIQKTSPVLGKYEKTVDRESAYEILSKREEAAAKEAEKLAKLEAKAKEAEAKAKARGKTTTRSRRMSTTERAVNNAASTASREVVRYVLRGIFGTRKR
ncbi:MAG: DUF853 domain-containing protein, partial [Alphaproteobacteria bacterium]|nr:DUF853 domain-containing protein [Alphaproteobacteria bacterium]